MHERKKKIKNNLHIGTTTNYLIFIFVVVSDPSSSPSIHSTTSFWINSNNKFIKKAKKQLSHFLFIFEFILKQNIFFWNCFKCVIPIWLVMMINWVVNSSDLFFTSVNSNYEKKWFCNSYKRRIIWHYLCGFVRAKHRSLHDD